MADDVVIATEVPERIHLNCSVGKSDKDYVVSLVSVDDGWVVDILYGRRGKTMNPGTKSKKGPQEYAVAKKLYDKVVREQFAEGYLVVGDAGSVYVAGPNQKEHSGVGCQLLNAIEEDDALLLNQDDAWLAQEKHDGQRMLLRKSGETVRAINRKGIYVGFPQALQGAANGLHGDFLIDGEAVGDQLRVFDIVEQNDIDLRSLPVEERLRRLALLVRGLNSNAIVMVPTAFSADDKARLYNRLLLQEREGIVYKRLGSPYSAGRPNSGGSQLKRKFYETCSVVVGPENDVRSVGLLLRSGDVWVNVGNCTIPANHAVPPQGSVVEVRYLYANRGGSLQQPVYIGPRTDINVDECAIGQLKYKSEEPDPDFQPRAFGA